MHETQYIIGTNLSYNKKPNPMPLQMAYHPLTVYTHSKGAHLNISTVGHSKAKSTPPFTSNLLHDVGPLLHHESIHTKPYRSIETLIAQSSKFLLAPSRSPTKCVLFY